MTSGYRFPFLGDEQVVAAFHSRRWRADSERYLRAVQTALSALATQPGVSGVQVLPATSAQDAGNLYVVVGLQGTEHMRQQRLPAQRTALQRAALQVSQGHLRASLVGASPVFSQVRDIDLHDLRTAELMALPAAALVLTIGMGSLGAACMPLLMAGSVVVVTTGILAALAAWAGLELDTLTLTVSCTLALGLGLVYALLLVMRYRKARRDGADPAHAMAMSTVTAGSTICWCAGAVTVTAAALFLVQARLVHALVVPAVVAACTAATVTLLVMPAALISCDRLLERGTLRRPCHQRRGEVLERWWERWSCHLMRRPWRYAIGLSLALTLAAAPVAWIGLGLDFDRWPIVIPVACWPVWKPTGWRASSACCCPIRQGHLPSRPTRW
ncbi:MMPL family transporter [Nonomuraea jabiensis]|uniref:MMPL family transporter n=1 Tax=Nonomuraea jabiensis TaxID=882448 RepID=UPI003685AFC8